jgi:hypothetical protein
MPEVLEVADEPAKPPPVEEVRKEAQQLRAETTTAAGELEQLVGKQEGGYGVAVALIAAVFGAAGWKFWSQRSEQAHELAKERLKMEAAAQGTNGQSPPACQAVHADLAKQLSSMTARVDAAEAKAEAAGKKAGSLSADFDGEALERQVKKLHKAVKELQEDKS